jgi:peptide/nickel transport system permease protein
VIYGDALRNALIPVVTILGMFRLPDGGNAVVESVFAWPGIGNYAVTALTTSDSAHPVFRAVRGCPVCGGQPAGRLVYGLADPRIRLG